ncbi:hypothetical protein GPK34_04880 [Secundilactobacillus kimchicus]|uniref:hypothetical protein n=1 Tax=Secundilactobacillus kimchicus TaxID=528209 RepID=UPI001C009DDD|nr:hypothetical protein [Secundilactobacillus kimchicus]MBT9671369.1 hypothetical protein [Secundilactobacillus kimchicus]
MTLNKPSKKVHRPLPWLLLSASAMLGLLIDPAKADTISSTELPVNQVSTVDSSTTTTPTSNTPNNSTPEVPTASATPSAADTEQTNDSEVTAEPTQNDTSEPAPITTVTTHYIDIDTQEPITFDGSIVDRAGYGIVRGSILSTTKSNNSTQFTVSSALLSANIPGYTQISDPTIDAHFPASGNKDLILYFTKIPANTSTGNDTTTPSNSFNFSSPNPEPDSSAPLASESPNHPPLSEDIEVVYIDQETQKPLLTQYLIANLNQTISNDLSPNQEMLREWKTNRQFDDTVQNLSGKQTTSVYKIPVTKLITAERYLLDQTTFDNRLSNSSTRQNKQTNQTSQQATPLPTFNPTTNSKMVNTNIRPKTQSAILDESFSSMILHAPTPGGGDDGAALLAEYFTSLSGKINFGTKAEE